MAWVFEGVVQHVLCTRMSGVAKLKLFVSRTQDAGQQPTVKRLWVAGLCFVVKPRGTSACRSTNKGNQPFFGWREKSVLMDGFPAKLLRY